MFNTPILFLIYNRLETTKQVFEAIKKIQPKFLFIAADGAKNEKLGEIRECELVKDFVINNINWDCEVKTLFRNENLGCGKAVSSAITWFFEHVEQGIILEDDCLPENSFFYFCENMLLKYKGNESVITISGTNYLFGKFNFNSYYFSNFSPIWGWATWKEKWEKYNFEISEEDLNDIYAKIKSRFNNKIISNWIIEMFKALKAKKLDTWDVQLIYLIIKENGLTIIPYNNLIKNIGYIGTHTQNIKKKHPFFDMPTSTIQTDSINHPLTLHIDKKLDLFTTKIIIKYNLRNSKLNILRKYTPNFIRENYRKIKSKF